MARRLTDRDGRHGASRSFHSPAKRAYGTPAALREGLGEKPGALRIPRPVTREDADRRDEVGRVSAAPTDHLDDPAARMDSRERQQQSSIRAKRVEPDGLWVGGAGVDEDRLDRPGVMGPAVSMDDLDIRPRGQVAAATSDKLRIHVDGDDTTGGSDQLSQDRRVVPGATPDVNDMLALLELEGLDHEGQEAWLAVVQQPRLVDRHEHIVVHVLGIGVRSGPVLARIPLVDSPGNRTEELFARYPGKGPDDGGRGQMARIGELLGVTLPDRVDRAQPLPPLSRPKMTWQDRTFA